MSYNLRNLGDCLRLELHPEAPAFIDYVDPAAPRHFSAREFDELCNGFAANLLDAGVKIGDCVGILGKNSAHYAIAYLGAMRAGAVATPINIKLPDETIRHILTDADVKLIFADAERSSFSDPAVPMYSLDTSEWFERRIHRDDFDIFDPDESDLAELLYTSGSTGLPKGVPLTHAGQCWATEENFKSPSELSGDALDVTIIAAPFYHMNGLFNLAVCLGNRTCVISVPKFDAEQYLQISARHSCTYLSGVPTMFAMAARVPNKPDPEKFSQVNLVYLGSAPLSEALIDDVRQLFPNAGIVNGYGTTESGPNMFGDHPEGIPRPPQSIGYPVKDMEWRFTNGSDEQGPFECKTPALTGGYLNRPEATAEKFNDGWYATNDIMRRDEDGFFYFVGRIDDMFVCGGENIYPGELEEILEKSSSIAQALVVPVPHDTKGQAPAAFIVKTQAGESLTEEAVKQFFLSNGAAYAHPRHVFFIENMPLAGTNKIDRNYLQRRAAELVTEASVTA